MAVGVTMCTCRMGDVVSALSEEELSFTEWAQEMSARPFDTDDYRRMERVMSTILDVRTNNAAAQELDLGALKRATEDDLQCIGEILAHAPHVKALRCA